VVEDFRRSLAFQADCLAGRVGGVGVQRDERPVCDRGARPTARHAQRTECRDRVPAHHTIVARGLGGGNGLSYRRQIPTKPDSALARGYPAHDGPRFEEPGGRKKSGRPLPAGASVRPLSGRRVGRSSRQYGPPSAGRAVETSISPPPAPANGSPHDAQESPSDRCRGAKVSRTSAVMGFSSRRARW
jgi:hypothetical protein